MRRPRLSVVVCLALSLTAAPRLVRGQATRSSPPRVSDRALALMNGVATRLQRARAIKAVFQMSETSGEQSAGSTRTYDLRARRPDDAVARMTYKLTDKSGKQTVRAFTTALQRGIHWSFSDGDSVAWRTPSSRQSWIDLRHLAGPLAAFFSDAGDHDIVELLWLPSRQTDPTLASLDHDGTAEWQGTTVEVVRWVRLFMQGMAAAGSTGGALDEVIDTTRFYIATSPDTVIRRAVTTSSRPGFRSEIVVTSLELDPGGATSAFAWAPPAGVKEKKREDRVVAKGDNPFVIGQKLPNFVLPGVDSSGSVRAVSLDQALGRNKALMLWKWASH